MSDDERPKKSWRELDRQRDRGGSATPRREPGERDRQKVEKSAAYSKYKNQLDKLFTPGGQALPESMRAKLGPVSAESEEKKKILDALRANPGDETLAAAIEKQVALPDDPRLLMTLLEVKDEGLIGPVLDALIAHVEGGKKPSRMLLLQKLTALENRTSDDELREKIGTLRAALG